MSTKIPISATCKMKEIVVVNPRLVLSLPPDSIRLSSNIRFLLHRPYVLLDTAPSLFAPVTPLGCKIRVSFCTSPLNLLAQGPTVAFGFDPELILGRPSPPGRPAFIIGVFPRLLRQS